MPGNSSAQSPVRRITLRLTVWALAIAAIAMPRLAGGQVIETRLAERPSPLSRVRSETSINKLLDGLEEEAAVNRFKDSWAWRIKGLIDQGPDAVPDLIAELDATDNDMMLRSLGFILRAIGDKRAVPALIRALPKTLRKPGSDMGCRAEDPELHAFMKKHDLDKEDRGEHYGFGRPVREIGGALEELTGANHREEEIYHTFLGGSPRQQQLQRRLFHDCAERWTNWWEKHWKEHVSGEKYAVVNLPKNEDVPIASFPHGPNVKIDGSSSGHIAEADSDPKARREVFFDFDTRRMLGLPEQLQKLKDDPNRLDKIQAWAAREGFDLMGTMYQPAGSDEAIYAIRNLGMTAWEIDADRYGRITGELKQAEPPKLQKPAGGLLLHYDEEKGEYDATANAAFLFITREGATGALFVGVEVLDTNVKLGVPLMGDPNVDPVGFVKGRRFGYKIVEVAEEGKKQ